MNKLSLGDKINSRMDKIQEQMEANIHLTDPDEVLNNIVNVSKFWSILSEEDRDYLQAARDAIEEKIKWQI